MEIARLRSALIILVAVFIFGTLGYSLVEGMSLFEAFYMTLITISTVGFGEVHPLSVEGRMITVVIIVTGISVGTYALGMILRIFVEGEMVKYFGRRRLKKKVVELKDHYIICGYGRIGSIVCQELDAENIKFVLIEQNPEKIEELERFNYLYLNMDATTEEALMRAGIMKAKGVVTAVSSDADNVFIALTAKGLRPEVFILSRASDVKNIEKMMRAGANRVICPYQIGGSRMAQTLKQPTVVDFIDSATMNSDLGLSMEEAVVGNTSDLAGRTLVESNLRKKYGVMIVAIKKPTGEMVFSPNPDEKLEGGDLLVVIGKKEDLKEMSTVLN